MRIRLVAAAAVASLVPLAVSADVADVDELVESVRQEALKEAAHDEERIDEFIDARAQQQQLLRDARSELARQNARADALRQEYEENELTLTRYEQELRERSGDLNDTFAIVRQTALNAHSVLNTSLVAGENPERSPFLEDLGKGETPPSIDDIKELWTSVLTEISESGKVRTFDSVVITPQGDEQEQTVTRVGVFNAVSGGNFLRYLPDSKKFVELSRQPPPRFGAMAKDLEDSGGGDGVVGMALDPSKGAILSLLVLSPDLKERVQQGGGIGYLILILGAIGVLIVIERAVGLLLTRRKIDAQEKAESPNEKNPLGRLQKVSTEMAGSPVDAIGIRLDEQLAEEASLLNRGLATVAVLAAVSPLLGLLGTVTGMIETFQSITLFGTGDPKLMSGGISQALVTTQLGLAVAIPLVLFHSLLTGRVNRLVERLGKSSSDLLTDR